MGLPQIQLQTGADGAIWRMCRLDLYRGEKVEEQDVPSRVGSRGARGVACTQAEARAQADRILSADIQLIESRVAFASQSWQVDALTRGATATSSSGEVSKVASLSSESSPCERTWT
mmetsp:Transcript_39544/g.58204  ORF Transcript_39544/g.58204 Transcript_39544/m.58204 type:complete len:117 (+) Transcript_39544:301-651(+)